MGTFKWDTNHLTYISVLLLLGFLTSYAVIRSGDVMTLGSDGLTHFYQAEALKEQITSDNPLLSGSWNWNWYNGYPFLKAYSPLYHYIVAITSLAFIVPATTSILLIILFSYPLMALTMYFFAYTFTKSKLTSFVIAILYLSVPAFLTEITIGGMMPRLLTYILSPLAFYLFEKMSSVFSFRMLVFATVALAAGFLANFGYFVIIVLFLTLVQFLKYILVQKFSPKVFAAIPLSVLLSSTVLLPQIYYVFSTGSPYFGPPRPVEFETLTSSSAWLVFQIGLPLLVVLLSLPLFIWNSLHNRARALRPRYLPYMIAFCVSLILFFSGIITGEINSILNLVSGKAMIFPLALLSPVVGSYCVRQAIRKKASVLLLLILATFLTTSFAPLYYWHIPSPEGLADSYVLLKKTSTTYRVPLFTDDFSQGRMSDWTTITGVWSISGGALISSGNGTEQIFMLNKNWTDHIVSAKVKWGLGSVGLVFRAQDANNSYIFNVDHSNSEASVLRMVNGTSKRLESVAISSTATKWLELRVEVNGTEIQCNIDNAFLFSVEDDTFQEGGIGLQTSDANASFDKVEISVRSFDEQKWFRVLSLPHYPRMLAAQILYGDFSSPDGWFDQGAERDNLSLIRYAESLLSEKTDEALRILSLFNVRYVVIDESDPVFFGTLSDAILHMSNSTAVSLVFQHAGVYVFELDEAYPVTASSSAFVIDDGDEISTFNEIIVNETFSPLRGVFLSKNNDLGKVSWQRWDWQVDHNGDANLTVNSVQTTSTGIEFGLTVNRSSLISIPISYLPGLRTEVDGQEVEMLKALPAFVAIQVPAGTHTISVSRQATTLENVSTIISAVTLVGLLSVPMVGFVKGRVRKRVASLNSDSNLQQMQ